MRAAVISDIHSNLPALEAVLGAIDDLEEAVEEIWCLGDVVGYGAQPDRCAELVRERCDTCLIGNHDLAVLGQLDISSFSAAAADAVRWTIENAAVETIEMLRPLSPSGLRSGIAIFHASPRDPVWEYVLSIDQAAECMQLQPERISLIGHSHVALYFAGPDEGGEAEGGITRGAQTPDGCAVDLAQGKWLLNPGSVGQPRDGDPRAAWLEIDTAELRAVFHRVDYEVAKAAGPILESGLPKHLAERLYAGNDSSLDSPRDAIDSLHTGLHHRPRQRPGAGFLRRIEQRQPASGGHGLRNRHQPRPGQEAQRRGKLHRGRDRRDQVRIQVTELQVASIRSYAGRSPGVPRGCSR